MGLEHRTATSSTVAAMQARDAYSVELIAPIERPRWRQFLARVFGALGDYPATDMGHVLITDAASGSVLASVSGNAEALADIQTDLDDLSDREFARRWLPGHADG